MYDYLLTIRIPFKTGDDLDARAEALDIISKAEPIKKSEVSFKLQRLEPNKAPIGVPI